MKKELNKSIGSSIDPKKIIHTKDDVDNRSFYRGEIWMADLGYDNKLHGEQQGFRPVVIISNWRNNKFSPTVIVASVTSQSKSSLPTHQSVKLQKDSVIMFEQIFTINKERLKHPAGKLTEMQVVEANYRMAISLGLIEHDWREIKWA